MFLLKKLLTAWLLPPFGLLVLALVVLFFLRRHRSGIIIAGTAVALVLSGSLPIVANLLSRSLDGVPISTEALHDAQAIVILGGGVHYAAPEYGGDTISQYSLERVRYGAKLARESKLPVLVTGGSVYGGKVEGELMKQILEVEFSVSVDWIEVRSRDTEENAAYSTPMLKAARIERIALVTHAWHMLRATAAFEKQGMKVMPAPTGFTPRSPSLFENLLPSASAFERSTLAIREWVGRIVLQ